MAHIKDWVKKSREALFFWDSKGFIDVGGSRDKEPAVLGIKYGGRSGSGYKPSTSEGSLREEWKARSDRITTHEGNHGRRKAHIGQ